jgi:hypothetical protein
VDRSRREGTAINTPTQEHAIIGRFDAGNIRLISSGEPTAKNLVFEAENATRRACGCL